MKMYTLIFIAIGVLLHLYTIFFKAEGDLNEFLIGLLLWSVIPYAVLLVLLRLKNETRALCATVAVLFVDISAYLAVFVFPQSSTASLALLWMPLWNLLLSIPAGIMIGSIIKKSTSKKKNQAI